MGKGLGTDAVQTVTTRDTRSLAREVRNQEATAAAALTTTGTPLLQRAVDKDLGCLVQRRRAH